MERNREESVDLQPHFCLTTTLGGLHLQVRKLRQARLLTYLLRFTLLMSIRGTF